MTSRLPSTPTDLFARAEEAAAAIRAADTEPPRIGIVLGTGLNELANWLPGRRDDPL